MSNTEFTVNADEVLRMFSEFDARRRKSVYRSAINRGLGIVKKQAATNLKSVIDSSKFNRIDQYGNSFKKGIKTKVYKDAKGGVIHIMSNFKVKFFEMGTKQREAKTWKGIPLKKARNTGSIKAYHFFSQAKQLKEVEVFSSINKLLTEAIIRINKKYGNGNQH